MTQYNLGNAYSTLAEVENKAENCKKAITAYNESLRVYIKYKLLYQCKMIQNNLEIAERMLEQDKGGN